VLEDGEEFAQNERLVVVHADQEEEVNEEGGEAEVDVDYVQSRAGLLKKKMLYDLKIMIMKY
jgi:hypothetical protein